MDDRVMLTNRLVFIESYDYNSYIIKSSNPTLVTDYR